MNLFYINECVFNYLKKSKYFIMDLKKYSPLPPILAHCIVDRHRKQIDIIDEKLIMLIEQRMRISFKIGKLKGDANLMIEDIDREEVIRKKLYLHSSLKKEDIDILYDTIFNLSKKYQVER